MWTHALLTFYRAMTRHRLYAALNVLGLAVGIAVFLMLWLDVRFETSFEHWIPDARAIYLVRTFWIGPDIPYSADHNSMGGTLDELRGDYPQLLGARDRKENATVRQGSHVTAEKIEIVDPDFFKVFDLPLAAGDKTRLLQSPDNVVLTETKAKRYFGAADPIGQPLTFFFQGAPHTYRVSGVIKDPPHNTDLQFDFLVPLTPQIAAAQPFWRQWGSEMLDTYLRFDRPQQARALDADLDNFVDRHAGQDLTPPPAHKIIRLRTQPILSMHLIEPKDAGVVAAIGAVGLLTMLLAAVNYVNLATARAGLRAREVALRKVMGATASSLVIQFLAEAMVTALLSALIGLALCELALPLVNAAGGLALKIDYLSADSILIPVLLAVIVIGLGAGVYPALVLSRFQPAAVLASARTPGGGRASGRVREALVLVQFAIAIAFTVATGVIVSQTHYLRHADLGFKRDGLIVVSNFDNSEVTGAQRASLLEAWRALPNVVKATAADISPGVQHTSNGSNTKRPGMAGEGPTVRYVQAQPDFFDTYGARLIAGRLLDRSHGDDAGPVPPASSQNAPQPGVPANVVVNAKALRTLGFRGASDAIGKTISAKFEGGRLNPMTIVGVIDDIHFLSPHRPVAATVYLMRTTDIDAALAGVRYAGADPRVVMDRMERDWRRIAPTVPFRAKTVEDNFQAYYRADDEHGRLFSLGAVLAVLIGCVGLYGLASFNTARRVREIGIRKTLGASTRDILRLLIGQFLRPVLLANLIAWPLAFLAMRGWLSSFDQKIDLGPGYFLVASALTLVIAVGAVAGQAITVARSEPAKALHHE